MIFVEALEVFSGMEFNSVPESDGFFHKFGIGNVIQMADRPYERFQHYMNLLRLLQREDANKFNKMHKGTPYYFMAWLSFQLFNYERGYYYVVAGLHEDKCNMPDKQWYEHNVSQFIIMDDPTKGPAANTISYLKNLIINNIENFNAQALRAQFNFDIFNNNFVKRIIDANFNNINIITTLYIFIFDCYFIEQDIKVGSNHGKTIQAILSNLFKGALIFESFVKQIYSQYITKNRPVLGDIITLPVFKEKYSNGETINSSADSLNDIIEVLTNENYAEDKRAMTVVSKVRNTTAHNLLWDDIFNDHNIFTRITQQIKNALFLLIVDNFPDV